MFPSAPSIAAPMRDTYLNSTPRGLYLYSMERFIKTHAKCTICDSSMRFRINPLSVKKEANKIC